MLVTLTLIALTCVVSFAAFGRQTLARRLAMWPPAVSQRREYWRFVTYGFVHADGQHLLFNMITLFFFGRLIESFYVPYVGMLGFAGFYLSALVASILPSYANHRNDAAYVSIGASGAVSAVLFTFILLRPWAQIIVFVVPVPAILYAAAYVAYSLYMDRRGRDNINHSAHLWGGAYGVMFTLLMDPDVWPAFLERVSHPRLGF